MPFYENVFIARQDILPPRVESLTREFSELVASHGGKIGKTEYWGLRAMAYRISRMRKAHYAFLDMEAPHQAIKELEKRMRLHEDILRFLTVRVSALDPNPSKPMEQLLAEERKEISGEEGGETTPAGEIQETREGLAPKTREGLAPKRLAPEAREPSDAAEQKEDPAAAAPVRGEPLPDKEGSPKDARPKEDPAPEDAAKEARPEDARAEEARPEDE